MESNSSEGRTASKESSIVNVRLFVSLVMLALLVVAADLFAVDIFGVETVAEAVVPFFVIVVGGYAGLTIADVFWERIFG